MIRLGGNGGGWGESRGERQAGVCPLKFCFLFFSLSDWNGRLAEASHFRSLAVRRLVDAISMLK